MAHKTNLCTTIMKSNISDLKNIIHFARKHDIKFVRFLPLRKKGRANRSWAELNEGVPFDEIEKFIEYAHEIAQQEIPDMKISSGLCGLVIDNKKFNINGHWCPIGSQLVIDTSGDVYPCVLCMEQNFKLGNIKNNSIDYFQKSSFLSELVHTITLRKERIPKCMKCTWRNFCQAGCMGLALDKFDTLWESDEGCRYRKKAYNKAMKSLIQGKKYFNFCKDEECG
jgi:uncharacterized protein